MNKLFPWVILAILIASPANAAKFSQLPSGGSVNSSTDQLVAVRSGTSLTSNTIAVGTQTFTTQSGLGYTSGQPISVVSTANSANFMQGTVSSYSGTTLSITVPITVPPSIGGAGHILSLEYLCRLSGNADCPQLIPSAFEQPE